MPDNDDAFFAGLHDDSYGAFNLGGFLYPNQGANLPGGGANLPGWATGGGGGGGGLPASWTRRDGSTMTRSNESDSLWQALLEAEGWGASSGAASGGSGPSGGDVMTGLEQGVGIFSELFNTFAPAVMAAELAKQGTSQDRIAEFRAQLAGAQTPAQQSQVQAQYAAEIEALRQANAALAAQQSGFWNPITVTVAGLLGLGFFGFMLTFAVRGMGSRNALGDSYDFGGSDFFGTDHYVPF